MVFALRNCNPRFERRIPFGQLCRLFLHLSVLVMNLGIKAFEYSIFLNHQFIRFLGSLLCLDKLPFSLLLLSNVRHHRDRTTPRGPTAANARPSLVRRVVPKTPARWIAQTRSATRASTSLGRNNR